MKQKHFIVMWAVFLLLLVDPSRSQDYFNLWTEPVTVAAGGCSQIAAKTAVFNGTSAYAYINSSSGLTGLADSKNVTWSCWVKFAGGDGAQQCITKFAASGGSSRWIVTRETDNKIQILGRNSAGSNILLVKSANTVNVASGWVHLYATFDMTTQAKARLYFNNVAETLTVTTHIDDVLDLNVGASGSYTIGATDAALLYFNGTMCELWMDDIYLDSPSSFYCTGKPANLGSTGNTPTGSAPAVYLSLNGNGNSWVVDSSGNANTFTSFSSALTAGTPP